MNESEVKNELQENNSNVIDKKQSKGAIVGIIILLVFVILIFKGCSSILFNVSDTSGIQYAKQYLESKPYPEYYVDTMYSIGKIASYDSSKIIESNEEKWYIFEVEISFNPKLNNGSTDLSRERQAKTYVVLNNVEDSFICTNSLSKARELTKEIN